MPAQITENHRVDDQGRPAGGTTEGIGMAIRWQDGPLAITERNGAFVEDLIEAAIGRLRFYNAGAFACRENTLALQHLEEALHWCQARTADREKRGVEGTHAL